MGKSKLYVVYKGDEIVATGTLEECARKLHIQPSTMRWYATPSARRNENSTIAVVVEDFDEQ